MFLIRMVFLQNNIVKHFAFSIYHTDLVAYGLLNIRGIYHKMSMMSLLVVFWRALPNDEKEAVNLKGNVYSVR